MLENASVELKTLVLLEFTKRLIISKNPMEFLVKQELSKTKRDEFIDKVKEKTRSFQLSSENFGQEKIGIQTQRKISMQRPIQTAPILKIPETRLPPQFAYLRPYATNEIDLDLGGLNPFLADSAVNVIESNGPGKAVIVKGGMGTKPTNVILSEQEINQIIQIFSKKSKIPAGEGAVKIVLGRYILSAIISEEAGSRFIIQKLPSAQQRR